MKYLLGVSAGLSINLDEPLLEDGLDLLSGQGVLQTVPNKKYCKINQLPSETDTLQKSAQTVAAHLIIYKVLQEGLFCKARSPLKKVP